MKKLILVIVFVFAIGTIMNANSYNDEIITSTNQTVEIVEEFGCAKDCVNDALAVVAPGRGNVKDDTLMTIYHYAYENCYNSNCR